MKTAKVSTMLPSNPVYWIRMPQTDVLHSPAASAGVGAAMYRRHWPVNTSAMKRKAAASSLSDLLTACLANDSMVRQLTSAQQACTKNDSSLALANSTTETTTIAVEASSTAISK